MRSIPCKGVEKRKMSVAKNVLVSCIWFFLCSELPAQINVGPRANVETKPLGKFEKPHLDRLKNSKTIFVYKDSDLYHLEELGKALRKVWTYSEIDLVSYDELRSGRYEGNYSFFTIELLEIVTTKGGYHYATNDYCFLHLWMKGDDDEVLSFCRIELQPEFEVLKQAMRSHHNSTFESAMEFIYKRSTIYNWHLTHLKTSLQYVNRKLFEAREHKLFDSVLKQNLSALKNDTLYIPEYVRVKFASFTGDESKRRNIDRTFRKYRYPYKVVSAEELYEISQDSGGTAYYLNYVKSSNSKYVSIFNGVNSELLYNEFILGYNLKAKDIKELSKAIKKAHRKFK